ncbi:MAG: cyclopropane fatty acyl phospholipid synthase [Prochlorothrix sp.]
MSSPALFQFLTTPLTGLVKPLIEQQLAAADIQINGDRPWDIQIHNPQFFSRIVLQGSLGLGESYMEGWWDCDALDQFFTHLLRSNVHEQVMPNSPAAVWEKAKTKVQNLQTLARSFQVGQHHYDLGNDLFQAMLDRRMIYSCGYWKHARNLDQAQEAKLELICQKLQLKPGMRLLDVGCGWGGLMQYAAEKYGVSCVGVTVSQAQKQLGEQRCADLPIEFKLQDYRTMADQSQPPFDRPFDRIVSVGMFEHVGYKNYGQFMAVLNRCLKPEGLCLLHTIGNRNSITYCELWTQKYIFPNGMIPSIAQIATAAESGWVIEDLHNFGPDYTPTLLAWLGNFNQHWPALEPRYGQPFYRLWKYFLCSTAGSFRARHMQLWQIVLSKNGVLGGYQAVR